MATLEDRKDWFRSMFYCAQCMTEGTEYKTCPYHTELAERLGIKGKQ